MTLAEHGSVIFSYLEELSYRKTMRLKQLYRVEFSYLEELSYRKTLVDLLGAAP